MEDASDTYKDPSLFLPDSLIHLSDSQATQHVCQGSIAKIHPRLSDISPVQVRLYVCLLPRRSILLIINSILWTDRRERVAETETAELLPLEATSCRISATWAENCAFRASNFSILLLAPFSSSVLRARLRRRAGPPSGPGYGPPLPGRRSCSTLLP